MMDVSTTLCYCLGDIVLHFTDVISTLYLFIAALMSFSGVMSLPSSYLYFLLFIQLTNYTYDTT